jgi:hypothetical protein
VGLASEAGEIDQLDRLAILHHRNASAPETRRTRTCLLDVDSERTILTVVNTQHPHLRESNQNLADAGSVGDHRGSSSLVVLVVVTLRLVGPASMRWMLVEGQ